MALSTYAELQTSVLNWLARPADPLVAPFVPEMIVLAESEMRRRLKVGEAEQRASLVTTTAGVALPPGCRQLRLVTSNGAVLPYVPPDQLRGGNGPPFQYTLHDSELRLGPAPSGEVTLEIIYQSGVPPLSDAAPTNWLLAAHPDAYLYSTLVAATAFIGHDERIPLWTQAAAAALASIEQADRKARWPGGLQIKVDGITTAAGGISGGGTSGAWTAVGAASPAFVEVVMTTELATGVGSSPQGTTVNIRNGTAAPITITLPPYPQPGQALRFKDVLGNAATYPVTLVSSPLSVILTSDSGVFLTSDSGAVLYAGALIDSAFTYFLFSDYAAVEFYWSGSQWSVR